MISFFLPSQGREHEQDAHDHPRGDGGHPLHVGRVVGDGVEDVDQHEEQRDEHGHPPGDHLRRDEEGGPGHHHEEPRGEVVHVQVLEVVPVEADLHAGDGEVAQVAVRQDPFATGNEIRYSEWSLRDKSE